MYERVGPFYELVGKDGITGLLDKVQKRVAAFGAMLQKVGSASAVAGAGLFAPMAALFKGGFDRGADLAKMSLQLGIPIEMLGKLQYAADAAGVSIDEVMQDFSGRYSGLIARAPAVDAGAAREAAKAQLEMADATRAVQQALMPLVKYFTLYVTKIAELVKNNAGAAQTVLAVGAGLIALGVTIKVLAAAMTAIIPVATAAWAAVTGPVGLGLVVGAVLGGTLFAGIAYLADGFETLRGAVGALGATFGTVFGGLKDALAKGDLETAWKIVVMGFLVAWTKLVADLTQAWVGFKMIFLDTWLTVVAGAKMVWNQFVGWLDKTLFGVIDTFVTAAARIAGAVPGGAALAKGLTDFKSRLPSETDIDRATARKGDAYATELAVELAERRKARKDDLKGAVEDAKKAEDALAALRAKAAEPGAKTENLFDQAAPLKQGLAGAIAVKGGFSSSALNQSLGVSDQAVKQTELLKLLVDGKGQLADQIGSKVGSAVAGAFTIKG